MDKKADAWEKRQKIWRHNGFRGSARMMQMQCRSILDSETANKASKETATKILRLASDLYESLKLRTDQ